MPANTNISIEKFHLLKLASLDSCDQKWVLKKLKKQNKVAFKAILQKISEARKFNLSFDDFNAISEELNLQSLFERNELDKKIDILNLLPKSKFDDLLSGLSYSDLMLFIRCYDALDIKKYIINKIRVSKEYVENKVDLNTIKNEKINACLIDYLFKHIVEVKK